MTSTCDDADITPEALISRLKAIRDARMRVLALISDLHEGVPTEWVEALGAVLTRPHGTADPDALLVLECITHAAAEPALDYGRRQALEHRGLVERLPAIARLFLTSSPAVALSPQLKKQLQPERALRPAGRMLTLGERKSLARTHRRDQIALLLRDPHPAVVTILLDNPHITETDVVRMSALRPASPESLARIAAHAKWSVRHAVKRALVQNPSTPLADAIRIATTLRASELAELAADASLPEPLRAHAAEVRATMVRR
jgi:hypothetical protein